nr:DNA-processing protein DprA [Roseateles oligotrophus]
MAAWLRLLETPGIGWESAHRLLQALGSPQAVFELPGTALQTLLSARQRQALSQEPAHLQDLLARTWRWLQDDEARSLLILGDADYPATLLATADPPLLLYLEGRRELLVGPALAVVGSRKPSAQGQDNAQAFAQALSEQGLTIVSGLALGVDGAAHRGGLAGRGSTIAVLGTGLDQIYPKCHQGLAAEIKAQGLLISEYTLGTPALAPNFPRRNRIIAGLGLGCLVVEAALQSGSLITARLASEAGREVFAIPGSIHSPQSRGCHALLRQGAKLVETTADVLDELPPLPAARQTRSDAELTPQTDGIPAAQAQVLALMGFEPVSLDQLMARGAWPAAELSAHLLELELLGEVARLAGQLFQRRARA